MTEAPAAVVSEYFRRVTTRHDNLADLFAPTASLVGLGTVVTGRAAISDFYRDAIERGSPTPQLIGALLVHGSRVAAEIIIELDGASPLHVLDLFVVNNGLIDSLTYFVADHP